jgi:hypothetical protein
MAKSSGRGRPASGAAVRPSAAIKSVPQRPIAVVPRGVPAASAGPPPAVRPPPGRVPASGLAGPAAGAPVGSRPLSPREAAALPSGARFVGLDGVPRIRR